MRTLQDLFEKNLHDKIKPEEFSAYLISKWFNEEKGIKLSDDQYKQLRKGLRKYINRNEFSNGLHVALEDDGRMLVSASRNGEGACIDISKAADIELDRLVDQIPILINDYVAEYSQQYLTEFHRNEGRLISYHQRENSQVEKNLFKKWGIPINLLELFILLSQNIGSEYNDFIYNLSTPEKTYARYEALVRSHARSCQVASEILHLLKGGFSDGAHARWRTLHEIAVSASIISSHDDDLAKRFLKHEIVQKYKYSIAYQDHCKELGYEPIPPDEMKFYSDSISELVRLYGEDYKNDNGWASQLIKSGRPTFSDLENLAKFDHMRPVYKFACLNVHSGSWALQYRLGLDESQKGLLLAGPSVFGLENPLMDSAYSLLQTTAFLLTYKVNIDYLVALNVLQKLEIEIFSAVDEILHSNKVYDE